ncbi:hypothetical protein V8Z74_14825 [Comamonas sp. w2-DMI]|uniref:hypothetical protein n=1 Tax=Comamonas sp. w2-DMI TaxID=3126391 RepID=UPI0032E3EB80
MSTFLGRSEIQTIYLALTLVEKSFDGDTAAGVHAMLHDEKQLKQKFQKYLATNLKRLLLREGIRMLPSFLILGYFTFEMIRGRVEDLFIPAFILLIGTSYFCITSFTNLRMHLAMRRHCIGFYESLERSPLGMNYAAYRTFLSKNPELQAYAASLGQNGGLLLRDMVAIKFRELQILGAV